MFRRHFHHDCMVAQRKIDSYNKLTIGANIPPPKMDSGISNFLDRITAVE